MEVIKVAEEVERIKAEHNVTGEFEGVINITLKKEDEPVQFLRLTMPKFADRDENEFTKW